MRRQITAFLPAPLAAEVDRVRACWDPVMSGLISAHLTLVHEAADEATGPSLLHAIRNAGSLLIRLTDVQCWGTPEGGIYVGVLDVRGDVARIRETLGVVEPPSVAYVPHVTVVHPKAVPASTLREAWDALAGWTLDTDVVLDRVAVVELVDAGWRVIDGITLNPS